MKKLKRLGSFLITLTIMLTFLPTMSIKTYAANDIKIISTTDITVEQAKAWAKTKGANDTFINLADLYWKYAKDHGNVNPAVAYVQSALETGYGKFGGVIDASFKNPCGMKKSTGGDDNDRNAHQTFASWEQGVQAHLDHLALYAGASGYPRSNTSDPRHFSTIKGHATTVTALNGKWASGDTYGLKVMNLYNDLVSKSNVNNSDEEDKSKDESNNNNSQTGSSDKDSKDEDSKDEDSDDEDSKDEDSKDEDSKDEDSKDEDSEEKDSKDEDSKDEDSKDEDSEEKKEEVVIKPYGNTSAPAGPSVYDQPYIGTDYSVYITSSIGWKYQGGSWYYYNSNGSKMAGWIKPSNYWYYLYSNGQMATGWTYLDGAWYYLNPDSSDGPQGSMKRGWLYRNGAWYFLQSDGSMATGFQRINGATYYLTESGAMKTGWLLKDGKWYFFNASGAMVTGWIKPNNFWYYLYDNGVMATGLAVINNVGYYLYSTGEMAEGWIDFGSGNYHYFKPYSGQMATNTVVDGWELAADGSRIKKQGSSSNNGSSSNTGDNGSSNSKLVVIDPGHNFGGDNGAYATHNGVTYCERDLNMQVAVKLRDKLISKGYRVVMTRTESERPTNAVAQSLYLRAKRANDLNADFFISIHHNDLDGANATKATGVETYYSDRVADADFGSAYNADRVNISKSYASVINNQVASLTSRYNRGAKEANFSVCRNTKMPSVLVEVGFICNPDEAAKCANAYYQDLAAQGMAQGISSKL